MTTTSITAPGENPGRQSSVSEGLAAALRSGNFGTFQTRSRWADCLVPLLTALGWQHYARELMEALPHFSEEFDLVDLRNVLVSLGYDSHPKQITPDRLSDELMPCLYVSGSEVYVLLERQGNELHYYDPDAHRHRHGRLPVRKGTAYYLTDLHPTHGLTDQKNVDSNWFANLLERFRSIVIHLLAMTGVLNIIALIIPLFVMIVYDRVIGTKTLDSLPYLIVGGAIILSADFMLRNLRARLIGSVAGRLDFLIGVETFRQVLHLPPVLTERSTVPAQLSRLKQFDSIRDFLAGPYAGVILELPFVLLFVLVMALVAGWIAVIPVVMIAAYIALGLIWLPVLDRRVEEAGQARTDKQRMLMQTFVGRRELKAHGASHNWEERFREVSGVAAMANYRTATGNAVLNVLAQSLMTVAGAGVLGFGAQAVMAGELSVGALIACMALIWRVLSPLQSAFLAFTRFEQVVKGIQQINQLMKLRTEHTSGASSLLATETNGAIRVDKVSFRYGPDQDPALLGNSFAASPGELVAVVGETGSGKSTLLKVIAGMYKPQAGAVLIDGGDIRQLNPMDLRRSTAYVPQIPKLFFGTVAQNMRLNNPLASDEELRNAALLAGVLEDIERLPNGFQTRLGDNDSERLPPGFAHGLCLVRALVRPSRLLLLDEPGASLDRASDEQLMAHLRALKGTKTVILVTHRPSHMRLADKVVVMDRGQIRFVGAPEQAIQILSESSQ
jgi:ATP-binding cassette subfamily C protein/ATP-binding cassette subfamily C protein LapB